MDITSFLMGMAKGKNSAAGDTETADFNLHLAEAMMTRDAKYLGDEKILDFRGFKLSNGKVLGNLKPYSFAGFDYVECMLLSDSMIMQSGSITHNAKLRILDITSNEFGLWSAWSGSLVYNPALEAVIVRRGTAAVKQVIFSAGSVDTTTDSDGTEHVNFYVYVPREDYDTIVAAIPSDSPVTADRYRVLEDYPEYDKWNEKYTVNFYDGDELVHTQTVRYGESVSKTYNPTKEYYVYCGWDADSSYVTSDMDIHAVWKLAFATAPWADIAAVSEAGEAKYHFSVGDTREETIGGITVILAVADFNYDDLENGNKAGVTIVSRSKFNETEYVASSSSKVNWNSNNISSNVDKLLSTMSADLQNVIKTVNKKYFTDAANTSLGTRACKLWALSYGEIKGTSSNSALNENERSLDRSYALFTDNASRKMGTNVTADFYCWLRSHKTNNLNEKGAIYAGTGSMMGDRYYTLKSNSWIGFCI